jgi:predicted transcriptional regulator
MAEDTNSSVRITNAQVYEKLMEINAVQIEMVAELRGMRDLPKRVNMAEQKLARFEWIEKMAFTALGSGLSGLFVAIWSVVR